MKLPSSFKEVSRVFQESFMGVLRLIERHFNRVFSGLQECFKEVSRVFLESF